MNLLAVLAIVAPLVSADLGATVQVTPRSWSDSIALAKAALAKLTLADKVSLGTGLGWSYTACVGNTAPIPSINFPGLCLQDSPTGIRFALNVSAFPASINVAATFDETLMYNNGRYMGEELRDKGVNLHLAPVANMMRTPQGGRGWEAQGADPFLTGTSVTNIIAGVQSNGVQSTLKHFVLNDQEAFRQANGSVIIDKKTLMEYYVRPFKMAIDSPHGSPTAIMCSYNSVNGVNACDDPVLMDLLKKEIGFNGFVMSDWWATHTELDGVNAGLDMVMPGSQACCDAGDRTKIPHWWGPDLVKEVNAGLVNTTRIDDLATRILTSWYRLRQDDAFPAPNFDSWKPDPVQLNVQRDHKTHIRAIGAASSVLLKNDGTLPLSAKLASIALIGSDAIAPPSGPPQGDKGVNPDGTLAQGWGSGTTNFPYIVSPQDGITAVAQPLGIKVTNSSDNWNIPAVTAAASKAALSIVFVNANSGEGYLTVDGNAGDRKNTTVWNNGDALVQASASQGKTVVVIHAPGAVDMPWSSHPNVSAIIMALMPGQETGNAIADILFGVVNPSGRLPFTIGHNITDYVTQINFDPSGSTERYSEGGYFDYRWNQKNNISPLFAFGHGLSYTSFAYSGTSASKACNGAATVQVQVANSGKADGAEVVQVYVGYPTGVDQPAKQLKGFKKTMISAGQTAAVSIDISVDALSVYDAATNSWVLPEGTYTAFVGAASDDLRGSATFVVDSKCSTSSASTSAASTSPASTSAASTSAAPSGTSVATSAATTSSAAATSAASSAYVPPASSVAPSYVAPSSSVAPTYVAPSPAATSYVAPVKPSNLYSGAHAAASAGALALVAAFFA